MTLAGSRCDFVIVGIGVNIAGLDFPTDIRATSLRKLLADRTRTLSVHDFAVQLLGKFEPLYQRFVRDGSGWVTRAFAACAELTAPGRTITIYTASGLVCGESLGIDPDGALLIRKDDGFVERVLSGDVATCTT